MCGFAGIIDGSGHTPADDLRATAGDMAETLRRRGPDDAGVWVDERASVALAFRRLAVLDLAETGHQPMASRNGRFVLVFNGEIYNHLELKGAVAASDGHTGWAGHSDTEILLACFAAWGVIPTLARTVGMFALALWDRQERRLHLARDRFGEKPLYYGWVPQTFVFGSELAALARHPRFDNPIDRDVLALYTEHAYVPAPYSIYRNVHKLEAGCVLSISLAAAAAAPARTLFAPTRHAGLTIDRYWSAAEAVQRAAAAPLTDESAAIDQLGAVLGEAVRLQSIADVPLGAFLSGGVDSSAIVALMQAHSTRRVKTFTIGFEVPGFNEAEHAKAVARHLGTDHEELYVSPAQAREVIPILPDLYSEPFADSSQIPTHLVSRIARRHVTVALSGDGGDELFGGYTRYLWGPRVWRRVRHLPGGVRRGLAGAIERIPIPVWDALAAGPIAGRRIARLGDKAHKLAYRLKHAAAADDLYRILVHIWDPSARLVIDAEPLTAPLDCVTRQHGGLRHVEERMMLWDALTYLPDDILHKVDRASMAVSLETRAPYLDHRVAEFAWRLPIHMKIRGGTSKWILRQLLYRFVPAELIERPKMGFGVPIDAWLRGPLREWGEDLLSEARLRADGYFRAAAVRRTWNEHVSGRRNWSNELWCVLMFQAWLDMHRRTPDRPGVTVPVAAAGPSRTGDADRTPAARA